MIKIKSISLLPSIKVNQDEKKDKKKNSIRINSQFLCGKSKPLQYVKHSRSHGSQSSIYKIPLNNLPKLKESLKINRNSSKVKISSCSSKQILEPIDFPMNSSTVNNSQEAKPQIGFFLFPKKNTKNLKHVIRKDKKDFSVSSWATEGNNFVWTLPGID
jgi:hypothetical protein